MKPKIKYRLEVWDTVVVMQILEMDERFRYIDTRTFHETNILNVCSIARSELAKDDICLRGYNRGRDLFVDQLFFETKAEAESYAQKVHDSLLDWAANWEGFADDYKVKDPVEVLEEYYNKSLHKPILGGVREIYVIEFCIALLKQNQPAPKPTLHQDGSIFTIG